MDHDQHANDVDHDEMHEEESRAMLDELREVIGDMPLQAELQQCETAYATLMAIDAILDSVRPRLEDPYLLTTIGPLHEKLVEVLHDVVVYANAHAILQDERDRGSKS